MVPMAKARPSRIRYGLVMSREKLCQVQENRDELENGTAVEVYDKVEWVNVRQTIVNVLRLLDDVRMKKGKDLRIERCKRVTNR